MPAKLHDQGYRFNLLILFGLSFSLATALIQGLGYHAPGFLGRALCTLLALLLCALGQRFPLPALACGAFLAAAAALGRQVAPAFLERICRVLPASRAPGALFWPLLVIAGVSLLLYVLVFGLKKPALPLLFIGLASFAPLWYLFVDSAYPAAVSYAACWLLLLSYRNGAGLWDRGTQKEGGWGELRRSWIHYTFLILAPALLIALMLPKNFAPLNWGALHDWGSRNFPILGTLRGEGGEGIRGGGLEFGFSAAGLRETGRLDEPLNRDPTVLLEVRGRGGLYLKGSVFDSYRGKNWTCRSGFAEQVHFPDPPAALSEALAEVELKIRHRRLRTKTVFTIPYPREVTDLPGPLQVDGNGGLSLPRSLPLGHEYTVRGFVQGYRADLAALETGEDLPPDLEIYLELPGNLPPRVRQLALEVTAGSKSGYEKMKALEDHLRSNYTYRAETVSLTAGMDFVDSFLFDTGEGYCTYFATALAVMGRAAGVPTRYVIGFRVPERRAAGGMYEVAGTDAHAWVEGYIPGAGWLPFEPTPGFSTADALPRRAMGEEHAVAPRIDGGVITPAPPGRGAHTGPQGGNLSPPSRLAGGPAATQLFRFMIRTSLLAAAAALAAFALLLWSRYRSIRKALRILERQEPRRRAVAYYNLALSLQEKMGAGKSPGETPREYSRRIIRDVYTWDLNFAEITEGINLALYSGGNRITPALAAKSRQFFLLIFNRYLSRAGRWAAFREILLQPLGSGLAKSLFCPTLPAPEK